MALFGVGKTMSLCCTIKTLKQSPFHNGLMERASLIIKPFPPSKEFKTQEPKPFCHWGIVYDNV